MMMMMKLQWFRSPDGGAAVFPVQGVWSAGLRAAGSVVQTRRAGGHEAADVRAEELEQLHVSEASGRCQTPRLHRPHLQSDAAHRHVDGLPEDGQKQQPEGMSGHMTWSPGAGGNTG